VAAIAEHQLLSTNSKHASQMLSTLGSYAFPSIGSKPVEEVGLKEVVGVLQPLWFEKTETASRVRGRIESVLAWASVSGFGSSENPARWKGNLDAVLAKPGKLAPVKHHSALTVAAVPKFFSELQHVGGMAARALEFLVLTAARSGQVRGAVWEEGDATVLLDRRRWRVGGLAWSGCYCQRRSPQRPIAGAAAILMMSGGCQRIDAVERDT
jgi:integrase